MFVRPLSAWLENPEPAGGSPAPTGQGQSPAPAPQAQQHADFGKPPAAPGEVRPAQVYLSPDDWAAVQTELKDLRSLRSQVQQELEAKEQARLEALAQKGEVQAAFEQHRQTYEQKLQAEQARAATVQQRWLDERKGAAVSEALAGLPFAGSDPRATAAMVRRLLSDEIEATLDSQGSPVVIDRMTRRPAVDYIRERLQSPEFAVFLAATNRGGTGSDGARPNATPNGQPLSQSEANALFAAQYRQRQEDARNARY